MIYERSPFYRIGEIAAVREEADFALWNLDDVRNARWSPGFADAHPLDGAFRARFATTYAESIGVCGATRT